MLFSAHTVEHDTTGNCYSLLTHTVPVYPRCSQYLSDWIWNNAVTQINAQQHTLLKAITVYKMPHTLFLFSHPGFLVIWRCCPGNCVPSLPRFPCPFATK
jgi:hypothetical protein